MTREKNFAMAGILAAAVAFFLVPPGSLLGQISQPESKTAVAHEAGETGEPAQTITAREKGILGQLEKLTKSEKLTLEGKAFLRYWYDIQDGVVNAPGEEEPQKNSFEIWRFYFGIRSQLAKWLTMRFTADVGPEATQETTEVEDHAHKVPGEQSYQLFVKFAWFNVEPMKGLNVRAGLVEFPMHEFIDNFWGYRYVAKNAGDENKLWYSADLGGYVKYLIPKNFGDLTVGIANGAGYRKALDTDTNKELWAYVMLQPFAPWIPVMEKLHFGATARIPMVFKDDLDKEVLLSPFVGYSHKWFTVGYHPLIKYTREAATDTSVERSHWGIGHGVYFRFDTPWKAGVLAQFNVWDEDKDKDSERAAYEFIGGLSYSPAAFFSVAASCFLGWSSEYDDPGTPDVDEGAEEMLVRLLISTELKF